MSPNSRQSTMKSTHTSQKASAPRHRQYPASQPVSFSTATREPQMANSHFSLSSTASAPRQRGHTSTWNMPPGTLPKDDSFAGMSNYVPFAFSQACFSDSMMSPVDTMDLGCDFSAVDALSGYTALADISPPVSVAEDMMIHDSMFTDLQNCPSMSSAQSAEEWLNGLSIHGMPSPPEEYSVDQQLQSLNCSSIQAAINVSGSEDSEYLGVSALQAYSGPRQQHRLLKPASDRRDVRLKNNASPDSHHSKEDHPDKMKARNDPLYDAKPGLDGLYRCPLVKDSPCSHKPTKQKCIYAKYLDSHLRPYKCKHITPGIDCEDLRFSSNACLFRHEREAHGLHNHGVNPYTCDYPDCERAKPGNGFPRRWNQRDHMKRVHAWIEEDARRSNHSDRHGSDSSKRRRGPGGPTSVPMRRSPGSRSTGGSQSKEGHRAVNTSRPSQASYAESMPVCNVYTYPTMAVGGYPIQMTMDPGNIVPQVAPYYQAVY